MREHLVSTVGQTFTQARQQQPVGEHAAGQTDGRDTRGLGALRCGFRRGPHDGLVETGREVCFADAAPQLNAAAEARGIRLAGTSVDLSGSGMADGNRPRPQFAAPQNSANPVSAARGDDVQAVTDGRIA